MSAVSRRDPNLHANPAALLGPVLEADYSASLDIVKKLIDGSLPGLPPFGWPLTDEGHPDLHVRALRAPTAAGQRYIGASPVLLDGRHRARAARARA